MQLRFTPIRLNTRLATSLKFITPVFLILALFIFMNDLHAEPWLSNRYAQNCASCHSPSRRNVEAKERRCTLACQGCHVNPNGGGMRNEYGIWNQQRWLRSAKSDFFKNKGTPAPLKHQKYADMPEHFSGSGSTDNNRRGLDQEKNKKNRDNNKQAKSRSKKSNTTMAEWDEYAKDGAKLVVLSDVTYNESDYDKSDREEHITVANRKEFMARLTEDDPYRLERTKSVAAGGDFRYFYLDSKKDYSDTTADRTYKTMLAMSFDLGVKVRPIPEHVSLVFEHRYAQSPNYQDPNKQSSPEKVFESSGAARSAYVMVDDLPYATYMMYGLYRPQFGHYSSDHNSLQNTIMFANNPTNTVGSTAITSTSALNSASATAVNKAFTIGGSPNVPFANIHIIMPTDENIGSYAFSQDRGYAATLGGRFVSYGASIMLSYWSTKGPRGGSGLELKNDMIGLTGGFTLKDFIVNVDWTSVDREFQPGGSDAGYVTTLEAKYRLFRELYLMTNYATSNIARNLKPGSATELMYGVKAFLLPGSEFELLMVNRDDKSKSDGTSATSASMQAQFHLYF